jgi:hypothetical protein
MPIKSSPASEIGRLTAALDSDEEVTREAAIARLAVIGRRAIDRLVAVYADSSTARGKRIAILRVLEAAGDARGLRIARGALSEGGDVAVAAAATLRGLLSNDVDPVSSSEALDALIGIALDAAAEKRVRIAASGALQDIPGDIRSRVAAALEDSSLLTAKRLGGSAPGDDAAEAVWQDAIAGRLPDDPAPLRSAVRTRAGSAALGSLQKLVDAARKRETETAGEARKKEWRALRGALHQALALRGSTVALYDLRETVAGSADALPSGFVAALQTIGNKSCLEAIAAAISRTASDNAWRHQLATAFAAIAQRERMTPSSAVMKRIAARWPQAAAVSTISRTTPRRKAARRI